MIEGAHVGHCGSLRMEVFQDELATMSSDQIADLDDWEKDEKDEKDEKR